MFHGIKIVQSDFAVSLRVEFRVEAWPIRKRRRAWRVRRIEHKDPAAYRLADGTMVVHPHIFQQLKAAPSKDNTQ